MAQLTSLYLNIIIMVGTLPWTPLARLSSPPGAGDLPSRISTHARQLRSAGDCVEVQPQPMRDSSGQAHVPDQPMKDSLWAGPCPSSPTLRDTTLKHMLKSHLEGFHELEPKCPGVVTSSPRSLYCLAPSLVPFLPPSLCLLGSLSR